MPLTIERCPDIAAAERRLGEWIAERRADRPLTRVNILVGSGLQRLYHQRRLARELGPLAALYFFTPADLAREITDRAELPPRIPLPPGAAPLLLDDIIGSIAEERRLEELTPDSPGLAEALHVTFTDLREGGVSADQFASFAAARSEGADDHRIINDLATIYRRWREQAATLRDRPSLYEDAVVAGEQPIRSALDDAPLFVSGIYDFTFLQRRVLHRCAEFVDVHVIFPNPPDDEHSGESARMLERENSDDESGRQSTPPTDVDRASVGLNVDVTAFSAADPYAEAAEIARRVIDAAHDGVKFDRMAVLHRGGPDADARLSDALSRAGAPVYIAAGAPVLQTAAGRAVRRLTALLCDEPTRADLLELLGNPALRRRLPAIDAAPTPLRWERVSRKAGLTTGWAKFEEQLQRHIDNIPSEHESDRRSPDHEAAESLLEVCRNLHRQARALKDADGWSSAIEIMRQAFNAYVDDLRADAGETTHDQGEVRLINTIWSAYNELEELSALRIEYNPKRLERAALSGLGRARNRSPRAFEGVMIGNAAGASRTVQFDLVFVPGMIERAFPALPRQDPVLPDSTRAQINQWLEGAGELRLGQHRTRQDRLVFTLLRQAARQHLTLSYARRSNPVGGPSHPSVLLLQALAGDNPLLAEGQLRDHDRFTYLPAAVSGAAPPPGDDGRVDDWESVLRAVDQSDLRLAMLSAPGVDARDLWHQLGDEQAERAKAARIARNSRRFTDFDGVIEPPGEHWDPFGEQAALSATSLERYAACPYRFFLHNVLGLRAVSDLEQGNELSALDRGNLTHRILEEWVRTWLESQSSPWLDYVSDQEALRRIAEEHLGQAKEAKQLGAPGIADSIERQILEDLEEVRVGEAARAARDSDWQPRAVERDFKDVELNAGNGRVIRVAGRIDRIDAAPGDRRRAIDYKTGKVRREAADSFRSGSIMQLPLYLHALAQTDGGELAESSAELFFVTRKGEFARERLDGGDLASPGTPDAPTPADELEHVLEVISDGIAGGRFFPFPFKAAKKDEHDLQCGWCDFKSACNAQVAQRYKHKQSHSLDTIAEFEKLVVKRKRT